MSSSVPWPHTRLTEHLRYQKSSHTHHVIGGHLSRGRRQSVSKRNQHTQWDHADEQTLPARTARIQNNKDCLKDLPTMSVSLPDHQTLANERNDMTTLDSRSNLRPDLARQHRPLHGPTATGAPDCSAILILGERGAQVHFCQEPCNSATEKG